MCTLEELARATGAALHGDGACAILGVATLQHARPGTISFLANPKYRRYLATTRASAVILGAEALPACPVSALVTGNPYATYARIVGILYPESLRPPGIAASATVERGAAVGAGVSIAANCLVEAGAALEDGVSLGPGCVVGRGTRIGEGTRLLANVTVCHNVLIGTRVLVHPGAVIGSDGFGIAKEDGRWIKVPQLGGVRIGDDVEIGANTTIDRGAIDDTVIEDGVKLDNQVQVAHNVHIGAHTAIAGCVGIAGSARIGRHCTVGGAAVILGHLELVDDVHITALSLVTKSISEPGIYSSGTPLQPNQQWHRNFARFRQLDDMARRLNELEARVAGAGADKAG